MVLPAGVTTALVYKKAPVSFAGGQAKVSIQITPSVRLIHTATGTPLADYIEFIDPAEGGVAQIQLPHTDQPGFQDEAGNAFTNWHYVARVQFEKEKHATKILPLQSFQVPSGQAEVDLSLIPHGTPAIATSTPMLTVTSVNGQTGAVSLDPVSYEQLARTPEALWTGALTYTNGAVTSAAVLWGDGTTGTYTGTPSVTFPGSIDSYTVTRGTVTYTQPAVTRDSAGNITNQPAITVS